MKKISIISMILAAIMTFAACSDDNNGTPGYDPTYGTGDVPSVVSLSIPDGSEDVDTIDSVVVTYDMPIFVPPVHSVKINDYYADSVKVENERQLVIYINTKGNTTYEVTIKKPTVHNGNYSYAPEYKFSFTTAIINNFDMSEFNLDQQLCNADATDEAKALYQYLLSVYGKQTLSATMADPAWNTTTAETMNEISGKYPAIHCFDFIHLRWSKPLGTANWIDYTNTTVVENWADAGGIVAANWHWSVPKTQDDIYNVNNYAFYATDNSFTAKRAVRSGTWENTQINTDLDALSQILLQLQDKHIAVLWRPLHEASGRWFWWGAGGAVVYRKLWEYVYNYMKDKGVNNLIWVWTSQGLSADGNDDSIWYPGDEYVDIIGRDDYDITDHESIKAEFDKLREITGGKKMVTLSECGQVPSVEEMLDKGDLWSWFMPWNGDYMTDKYNSAEFFTKQMNSKYVITRDELPKLR